MNARLIVATMVLIPLGTDVAFAQAYAGQGPVPTGPGEAPTTAPSYQTPYNSTPPSVGVVTLKPGQTFTTTTPQDYGSVQAGATPFHTQSSANAETSGGG